MPLTVAVTVSVIVSVTVSATIGACSIVVSVLRRASNGRGDLRRCESKGINPAPLPPPPRGPQTGRRQCAVADTRGAKKTK